MGAGLGSLGPNHTPGMGVTLVGTVAKRNRLEVLDEAQCLALLGSVDVGRVGISTGALPAILPVNFAVRGRDIVFRTVPGTKLAAAVAGTVVAFEADQAPSGADGAWSVLVRGVAEEVTDPDQRRALEPLAPSWAFDGEADHVVRIPIALISGRRFRREH